ncbi:DUF2252 family protein [Pseudonocardia sp. T1-2H]|uniref:DUF2252 family protein n=1 Tax=Pseudonocardia sp. T1-2H TaxID=3128899 RepID=UPI003100E5F7
MLDVNDFGETLPGPWERDVKRLAASIEVAGRGSRVASAGSRRGSGAPPWRQPSRTQPPQTAGLPPGEGADSGRPGSPETGEARAPSPTEHVEHSSNRIGHQARPLMLLPTVTGDGDVQADIGHAGWHHWIRGTRGRRR